jgi:hypothetical protein
MRGTYYAGLIFISYEGYLVMFQSALKYNVEVTQTKQVEFPVPFSAGTQLTVFVISEQLVQ